MQEEYKLVDVEEVLNAPTRNFLAFLIEDSERGNTDLYWVVGNRNNNSTYKISFIVEEMEHDKTAYVN